MTEKALRKAVRPGIHAIESLLKEGSALSASRTSVSRLASRSRSCLDPIARTLEAFQFEHGDWHEIGRFFGAQKAAVPPFEAVTFDPDGMWLPRRQNRQP